MTSIGVGKYKISGIPRTHRPIYIGIFSLNAMKHLYNNIRLELLLSPHCYDACYCYTFYILQHFNL